MAGLGRFVHGLLLGAGLWLAAAALASAGERGGIEDAVLVKTAFVYNFAKFTRWPEGAGEGPGAPLTLCIAGEDELAEGLWRLRGKAVKGQPLAVLAVKDGHPAKACDLLYVALSEHWRAADYIRATRGLPILTVSEIDRFAHAGGMIALYRDQDRIRFAINLGAARAAGLELSPSLLSLAVVIGQD